ncbi:hypothetical protein CS022_19040 [Veronia nyctiphanis]|uniref:DUF2846 domain-containing protein n=1 Tax=Veronia nyctiphanis TaxID=1278244 RepID=A0A4Q0YPG3_9GAMM|nr:hypothetical protein [Veronia nyctiphanis]RXJ71864.1 hypothetical protein CS022_19040 [Veronia nyctiphanis]
MKTILSISAIASLLLLGGCTSIPTVQKGTDEYNELLNFKPVSDKAVIYIYRRLNSDHKGLMTTIDIGKEELPTVSNCVVRHIVDGGQFNIEPNGMGLFAIEKELNVSFPSGSVNALELKHTARIAVPNVSELFLRSTDELKKAINDENLCLIDGENI